QNGPASRRLSSADADPARAPSATMPRRAAMIVVRFIEWSFPSVVVVRMERRAPVLPLSGGTARARPGPRPVVAPEGSSNQWKLRRKVSAGEAHATLGATGMNADRDM